MSELIKSINKSTTLSVIHNNEKSTILSINPIGRKIRSSSYRVMLRKKRKKDIKKFKLNDL